MYETLTRCFCSLTVCVDSLLRNTIPMSIINRLVARLGSAEKEEPRPYQCRTCQRQFARQYYICPACGGFRVDRTEWSYFAES